MARTATSWAQSTPPLSTFLFPWHWTCEKKSFPRQQLFLYIASSIHQQIKRALRSSSKDVTENFSLLKRRVYSLSPHYFTNNLMQGSFQKNLWPPTFFPVLFAPRHSKKIARLGLKYIHNNQRIVILGRTFQICIF